MSKEILRAKTKFLFDRFPLTKEQKQNSELNLREVNERKAILQSAPRHAHGSTFFSINFMWRLSV